VPQEATRGRQRLPRSGTRGVGQGHLRQIAFDTVAHFPHPHGLQQAAEVVVRVGVPRIRRDRRAVGRLRAVEVLSLVLQQDAEVEVRVGVPRIRCDRRPGFLFFALILCEEYLSTFADLVLT
jgi:hypothetical protein